MGSNQYIGEITLFAGNFAPRSTAFCQGQTLAIAQNTALFSILGTTYGGNGQVTFALPDLRGRVPLQQGQGPGLSGYSLGQSGGTETTTLSINQMPTHTHTATSNATTVKATLQTPAAGALLAKATDSVGTAVPLIYAPAGATQVVALAGDTVSNTGGSQPFNILQPYLGLNFIITLFGIFPARN